MTRVIAITAFMVVLVFSRSVVAQENTENIKCFGAQEMVQLALPEVGPKNLSFSLKNEGNLDYVVFISKAKPAGSDQPWLLFKYQKKADKYCTVASGKKVEPLMSVSTSNFNDRYGMPGSGYPRCSNGTSLLPGSADVRFWANRELGDSSIISLGASGGEKDYTLLLSKDHYWILLDIDHSQNLASCYVARGDGADSFQDLTPLPPK